MVATGVVDMELRSYRVRAQLSLARCVIHNITLRVVPPDLSSKVQGCVGPPGDPDAALHTVKSGALGRGPPAASALN